MASSHQASENSMAKVNQSKYAVLGMLSFQPMSGYDIKQHLENSVNHFWTISYTQIYAMLKRLEAEKLVTQTVELQTGRPNRYIYALTEAGRQQLQDWLRQPIRVEPDRLALSLKLFFGHEVQPEDMIAHLRHYQSQLQDTVALYKTIEKNREELPEDHQSHPDYTYLTLRRGIHLMQAQLAWCEESLATLLAWQDDHTS